jgi:hypothetical protein
MAKQKLNREKRAQTDSEDLGEYKLLRTTTIADGNGKVYVFQLWASIERPHYMIQVGIAGLSGPRKGPQFGVDLRSLQKLTAWFAKAVLIVNKHEDSLPEDSED